MSDLATLKALLEQQNKAFAEFKQANDERLKQIEQKGTADAVTVEKVEKLSAELDKLGDNFKALEKLSTRPGRGGDDAAVERQAKRLETANLHLQSLAGLKGRSTKLFGDHADVEKYAAEFRGYLRHGDATTMQGWIRQDFQISVDGDGGFLVPPDMSGRIVTRLYERSDIRAIAYVQPTSVSELEGIADIADVDAGWRGETEPVTDTATTNMDKWTIMVDEMWAQPRASTRLIADATLDIENWVSGKVGDRFARLENVAFVNGDGVKKPRGFLTYGLDKAADGSRAWGKLQYRPTGAAGQFKDGTSGEVLIDLTADLKPAYRANARWVGARSTFAAVRKLKDSMGQYLWQPSMQVGQPATLLGYPVAEAEDMPVIGNNALSLGFGDFREGYTIVDRAGMTILRDPYTAKGWVKFYATARVGGGVTNFDAIKLLKFGTS